MSTSTILSALRVGGRQHITASNLGARAQATGSHLFRIHRFTQVREKVANGAAVYSSPFGVGGHDWRIKCYPNGDEEKTQGHISLYLWHNSHARTGDATANYKLSILDQASKPTCTQASKQRVFSGKCWGWDKFMKLEDLDNKEKHRLLEVDCLSVLCDVTVDLGLTTDDYTDEELASKAPPPFHLHGLAESLWNREAVDVKILVGDGRQTLAAHRWVLEAGSPVFKADLALVSNDGGVAELRVDDMDADVCKALLRFMYTGSPPPNNKELETMAERLLVAADRYEVEKLKLVCEEALCKNVDTSSVVATLTLAERHGCPILREACMQFLSSPGNLNVVLASSDGFRKLKTGCPSALLDLYMHKKMPPQDQFIISTTI